MFQSNFTGKFKCHMSARKKHSVSCVKTITVLLQAGTRLKNHVQLCYPHVIKKIKLEEKFLQIGL